VRRKYLLALGALLVISVMAVLVASGADPAEVGQPVDVDDLPVLADDVPGPDQADGWIGSEPLTRASLAGSVVVYDFWTYSCVNCVRTLPHLAAWYDRYQADGLVIVGVHSPEFEFEKDRGNVERAVGDLEVDWPVALDPERRVWNAFSNRYWPAKYVVDRDGRLRYVHYGEGAYDETEREIQELLGVERELVPPVRPEDEPGVILPAQTEDQPGAYSGPYEAGGVYAVLEGEGEVVVDARAIAVSEPGCYELVTHPHHTQAVLHLRVGAGVTCHATCFTPAIPAAAPSGAARRPR
jgi:thiol-disulfide isomerase/thioredoxin